MNKVNETMNGEDCIAGSSANKWMNKVNEAMNGGDCIMGS